MSKTDKVARLQISGDMARALGLVPRMKGAARDKKSDEDLISKAEEEEWNQIDKDVKKKLPITVENPGGR